MKQRLDQALAEQGLVASRSQAESYIRLGQVKVNDTVVTKPGFFIDQTDKLELTASEQYVSRAALKLASVAKVLGLNFKDKVVLDIGSSTGGFTQFALQQGARQVIAVDVGTDQLHTSLRADPRIVLHEQTDIRNVYLKGQINDPMATYIIKPDLIVADVSFISLRQLLPHIAQLMDGYTQLAAMFKPQFESGDLSKHKGVIKNDRLRREILKDFETWVKTLFVIKDKADSAVAGSKGNRERFYLLQKL